jgi:hypothetical protein
MYAENMIKTLVIPDGNKPPLIPLIS